MTHRDRVMLALSHEDPDRIPVDLGATPVTGIHEQAYRVLREYIGLPAIDPVIVNRMQQTVLPDEDVLQFLGVDVRGIFMGPIRASMCEEYPDGSYRDMWGVVRAKPPGSYYFDMVGSPLDREDLTVREVEKFPWPDYRDPAIYETIEERCRTLEGIDSARVFNLGAAVVQISQFMRGYVRWYEDLILRPELIQSIMDHITEFHLGVAGEVLKRIGDQIDVVFFGDDLGTQHSLQFSPEAYRSVVKPFHRKLFRFVKERSRARVLLHSCGAIFPIVGDLVDAGVDILNPVQVSAEGMEIEALKRQFGKELCFWGAIDNQRVLPTGTPSDVMKAVARTVDVLGRGGGYVLCASHNLQPGTPPENILSMYETARGRVEPS
ncbi:MAG: hypothetical protein NUW23_02790 [Firmicutes bacterium]|nr:hypothetical protein [Bacillota bacterium]